VLALIVAAERTRRTSETQPRELTAARLPLFNTHRLTSPRARLSFACMSAKPAATRAAKNQPPAPRLKIVVRRLPPNLPEAVFWASTAPWIVRESDVDAEVPEGAERVAWSCFRAGKVRRRCVPSISSFGPRTDERATRSGKDKDDVHSRAYAAFKTVEALVAFHRGYDGWSFRDKQGELSPSSLHDVSLADSCGEYREYKSGGGGVCTASEDPRGSRQGGSQTGNYRRG
jgi:hypothetical protein